MKKKLMSGWVRSNKLDCPVTLRLVAKKGKDVLEIVTCNMSHNHVLPSKEELKDRSQDITSAACKLLKQQIEATPGESAVEIKFEEARVFHKRSDVQSSIYKVNGNKCSCLFNLQRQLPCWHLLLYRHAAGLAAFDDIPIHWLTRTLGVVIEANRCDPGMSSVEIVEGEKESGSKKKRKMNEVQKRSMVTELWKEVLKGIVARGHDPFLERCKLLKYLRNVWKHGKDVYSWKCVEILMTGRKQTLQTQSTLTPHQMWVTEPKVQTWDIGLTQPLSSTTVTHQTWDIGLTQPLRSTTATHQTWDIGLTQPLSSTTVTHQTWDIGLTQPLRSLCLSGEVFKNPM
ncbi:hypothetical protein EGW08_022231 [Elysia chlorotica]|uniref:SWIM-type domain-containing protein n=1 Tax=Elysia chlorotica TaxID=188477 RepID=A0A3S1BLP0_ELYCH|nr:hypothetical protein EGW08_022231 [Elysia chlorotica]